MKAHTPLAALLPAALLTALLLPAAALADHSAPPRPGSTPVVLEREALLRRLTQLEEQLVEALERGHRGQSRRLLRRALEEMEDLQELVAQAPPLRSSPQPPPPRPAVQPLTEEAFSQLNAAMARESWGQGKLRILRGVADRNYFLVSHVLRLLPQFTFARERLEAVRLLWPRVLDRDSGYQLYDAFHFDSEKDALEDILRS